MRSEELGAVHINLLGIHRLDLLLDDDVLGEDIEDLLGEEK